MVKTIWFVLLNFTLAVMLFLFTELLVRLFKPEINTVGTTESIVADSLYYETYGLRPLSSGTSNGASVSIDRYGFRKSNNKIDTSKASWLLLGDSVTFGIGVEDDSTFSAIVNSNIDSLNILNPSAIGYNINSYWNVFKYLIFENQHDLKISKVSLIWCLNDVYNDVPDFEIPGGKIRYFFSDLIIYIRVHSRLYHFIKSLAFDRSKTYFLYDKSFYNVKNSDFQNSIKIIHKMNDLCNDRNIAFDIILMPYEFQLRQGEFTPQNLMIETLQDKISIDNPFLIKRNSILNSKIYFLYGDGMHFSNYGHKYIAELLINFYINK